MNEEQAQKQHDDRLEAEPDHDMISCWCCCQTCDFDYKAVIEATEEQ